VVHRRQHEFRGDAKLTTWLYRITERVVIDRRRMERRRRWLRGLFGGLPPPPPEDPSVLAERRQMERVLYRMLEDLPERSRTLILLFEVEGLSGEEIAELMDLPLRSLWVYLHRARAALRRCVESLDVDTGAVWERAAAGRRP
jgi:RNA polymerase sigma-70 factor (ECF subfamily)